MPTLEPLSFLHTSVENHLVIPVFGFEWIFPPDTKVLTISLLELFCLFVHHRALSPDSNTELHGGALSLLYWSPPLSSITRLYHGVLTKFYHQAPSQSSATDLHGSPSPGSIKKLYHWSPPLSSITKLHHGALTSSITKLHHRPLSLVSINKLFHQAPDLALLPEQQVLSGKIFNHVVYCWHMILSANFKNLWSWLRCF